MAALSTDYFMDMTPVFATTIGAGGVAGAGTTTIPLNSVSGLSTTTGIELTINRIDADGELTNNYETVRGVISGSNLTSCVRGVEGTAQAWSAGVVVEMLVTADWFNRAVDGITTALEQTGRTKTEQWYAADAGANDTYAITMSPAPTAYTTGMVVNFKANTANTGTATLNVNSLGAKTIKKNHDQTLADGDIESGQIVTVIYDGTDFQMQSQTGVVPATLTGSETLTNKTLSTGTKVSLGSDAQGDIYYNAGSGVLARLGPGTSGQFLKTQGASANPVWASAGGALTDEDDSGSSSTSSSTFANITGADCSITLVATSHIVLMATVSAYQNAGSTKAYGIQLHDGTSLIGVEVRSDLPTGNARTCTTIMAIAQSQSAGAHTYTVQHRSQDNSTSITAEVTNFIAFSIPA